MMPEQQQRLLLCCAEEDELIPSERWTIVKMEQRIYLSWELRYYPFLDIPIKKTIVQMNQVFSSPGS